MWYSFSTFFISSWPTFCVESVLGPNIKVIVTITLDRPIPGTLHTQYNYTRQAGTWYLAYSVRLHWTGRYLVPCILSTIKLYRPVPLNTSTQIALLCIHDYMADGLPVSMDHYSLHLLHKTYWVHYTQVL